jgi:hypothetical protein
MTKSIIEAVTLGIALFGAFLGILNTWFAFNARSGLPPVWMTVG